MDDLDDTAPLESPIDGQTDAPIDLTRPAPPGVARQLVHDHPNSPPQPAPGQPVIVLQGAEVLQNKNLVLSNASFTLGAGEFAYLIGRTGTGKTSLLKILYGDLRLHEGSGNVVGFDLQTLTKPQIPYLRRRLGIVFQDFQLLTDRTLNQNLRFVLEATGWDDKGAMAERIDEVLTQVGLGTKGHKRPHELSGGEQQRIGIARALLNAPSLIIADEPTGNLDPDTSKDIMNLLGRINRDGTAILMATHDYYLIEKFPARILRCGDGALTDLGTHWLG